ncbi:MAG: signal peptidase I [Lachnospiraceae bacterium]|nr:signal peptidase I [Lachnospiraceae bacterium]
MLAQSREIDSLTDELRKEKARSRGEEGEVAETEQNGTVDNTPDSLPDSPEDSIEEAADSPSALPETANLETLVNRIRYEKRFRSSIINTLMTLVVVAAAAILIAILVLPILRIYGQSMSETLDNGDIVVSVKTADLETGDIVAFYYNNTILVKRVIGQSGDWIDIAKDGTVSVNQQELEEPYLDKKAYGEIDIKLPYQVPEGRIFVMGDNREISIDSRTMMIGCVAEEQIVGKIIYRVWPFGKLGGIK